jgi:hypothetical protein
MLVVMQLHGLGIDMGLESGVVIGKRWKFVSQVSSPSRAIAGGETMAGSPLGLIRLCVSDDNGCGEWMPRCNTEHS